MTQNTRAVELLTGDMVNRHRRAFGPGPRAHRADVRAAGFALSYLDAFGYLKDELAAWKDISLQDIKLAIGDLQASLGLKKTRGLTVQTVRAMEAPRCGCPDVVRPRHKCHVACRSEAGRPEWGGEGLKYFVAATPPGLTKTAYAAAVDNAFSVWTQHANVSATRAVSLKYADVVFDTADGPDSNFDGPGGTLAWTGRTGEKLVVMLDASETWTLDPRLIGACVHNVLAHEVGHVFGLGHSKVPGALMCPLYNAAVMAPQATDAAQLIVRYGKRPVAARAGGPVLLPVNAEDAVAALTAAGYKVGGR